jgi:hypothetical protein
MRRALAITLLLLGYATAQAGGEKVHNLTGGNLKIDGAVADDDPKVKVTHPDVKITVELPAKVYKVKLPAGKLQIDITSTAIDPVLAVQDKTGKQLAFDDDGGEGLNSRLQFQAPKEDVYNIVAASLKGAGDFTLTVKVLAAGAPVAGGKDSKFEGKVSSDDPKVAWMIMGQELPLPAKKHAVNLEAGQKFQIDLVAKTPKFDPVLIIHDAAGKQIAFDDDGGGFPHSRLQFQTPKTGAYTLYAAALSGEGDYVLTLKGAGTGTAVPPKGKVLEVGAGGLKLTGALNRQTKSIAYQVKLEAGKSYVIEMDSPDQKALDPYIEVRDAAGKKLAEDDDGAGDLNARLVFRAPENGVYQIVARSFNQGIGDYTLMIREE